MSNDTFRVTDVRFEHHREPFGIGEARPRVSWKVATELRNWRQVEYELEVLDESRTVVGSSGRVASPDSVLVPWPDPPLRSRDQRRVRVRVFGADGSGPSHWSADYPVEAGLLRPSDWIAEFITPEMPEGDDPSRRPGPLLRHEFDLPESVRSARLYCTALGVYEVELNGVRIGDHVLAPGWTSYDHRLRYQIFNVTDMLRTGRNAMGALLADGWFRGRLGFGGGQSDIYGDRLAFLAQLEVTYPDGRQERICSGPPWRSASGPIIASSLYDGEIYDAQAEREGWSEPGFDDSGWSGVRPVEYDMSRLVAPDGPPVRRTETVEPVSILTSPAGHPIVDFRPEPRGAGSNPGPGRGGPGRHRAARGSAGT